MISPIHSVRTSALLTITGKFGALLDSTQPLQCGIWTLATLLISVDICWSCDVRRFWSNLGIQLGHVQSARHGFAGAIISGCWATLLKNWKMYSSDWFLYKMEWGKKKRPAIAILRRSSVKVHLRSTLFLSFCLRQCLFQLLERTSESVCSTTQWPSHESEGP